MPFGPDHLRTSGRHDDILNYVGLAIDMKGDLRGLIRGNILAACQGYACNDIRVNTVGIIRSLQFGVLNAFIGDNAYAQCG